MYYLKPKCTSALPDPLAGNKTSHFYGKGGERKGGKCKGVREVKVRGREGSGPDERG